MFDNIVIATHGKFGIELLKSVEMIIGKQNKVTACSYLEGMTLEKLSLEIENCVGNNDTLVFVDILGGTPYNVAMKLSKEKNISLITGVNLAILIEACMNIKNYSKTDFIKFLIQSGINSIKSLEI